MQRYGALGLLAVLIAGLAMAGESPRGKRGPRAGLSARERVPADLKLVDGIVFKQVAGVELDLWLFEPLVKKFDRAPLVVYIHGGGWASGDKSRVMRADVIDVVRSLNQNGIACASIEYRLTGAGTAVTVAECVADCKDAVRFLAAHADEYVIDPARIGTFGGSAGGHLSLMTAWASDEGFPLDESIEGPAVKVRCAVAYYPATTFVDPAVMQGSNFERRERFLPFLGGTYEEKIDLARRVSPLLVLSKTVPPTLIVHGDNDRVLNVKHALAAREAASRIGAPVECLIVKGAGHGFSGEAIDPPLNEITRRTTAFFLEHLGQRQP